MDYTGMCFTLEFVLEVAVVGFIMGFALGWIGIYYIYASTDDEDE